MRWLRGLGALALLVLVVLGAPVVLLAWGRPSLTGLDWGVDDGSLLLALLTWLGWLAWAAFTASVVAEAIRLASGRRFAVDLPVLGGLQALCASLLLAVVTLSAAQPQPGAGEGTARTESVRTLASVSAPPRAGEAVDAAQGEPSAELPPDVPTYRVQRGDDLWSLAQRLLGDGARWRELAAANPDLLTEPTAPLVPGTVLVVPGEARPQGQQPDPVVGPGGRVGAAAEVGSAAAGRVGTDGEADGPGGRVGAAAEDRRPRTVRVRRSDTLSQLALDHLGAARRWPQLQRLNADRIDDPDHIEVGWVLRLPDAVGPEPGHKERDEPVDRVASDRFPDRATPGEPAGAGVETTAPVPSASSLPAAPVPAPAEFPEPALPSRMPAETLPAPGPADSAPAERESPADLLLLGTLGALAAAGIAGGWQARRLLQSRVRQPGRRLTQPTGYAERVQAALSRRQRLDQVEVLQAALRAMSRHFHATGGQLPRLAEAYLDEASIRFCWSSPTDPPPVGFTGTTSCWQVGLLEGEGPPDDADDHPCAFPALVTLGRDPDGTAVLVDLERGSCLGVSAESADLREGALAAMGLELACSPWAGELRITVVGGDPSLLLAAGGDAIEVVAEVETALAHLERRRNERLLALAGRPAATLRVDPDLADAVAPHVLVILEPLPAAQLARLDELVGGDFALAAIVPVEQPGEATWNLAGDGLEPAGRFGGLDLVAQAVPAQTRAALTSLLDLADDPSTTSAPWWRDDPAGNVRALHQYQRPSEDPVDIVRLRRREPPAPFLRLIGPIELVGAAGPEPARSRAQLLELCGWLLQHPGRTSTQMADALAIAEGTRRSNMSRLRSWLGEDPEGRPYLPDAYSGRIRLHPDVTCDADDLAVLTATGVNRLPDSSLVATLELVRGGVLADAAPSQWFWAEELRADLVGTLRDAALVLAERALAVDDLDLGRWAVQRGLTIAPEDELLLCARIRLEAAAGNQVAVERLVGRLTQTARALGVDLLPATVEMCQQVVEGRLRARQA